MRFKWVIYFMNLFSFQAIASSIAYTRAPEVQHEHYDYLEFMQNVKKMFGINRDRSISEPKEVDANTTKEFLKLFESNFTMKVLKVFKTFSQPSSDDSPLPNISINCQEGLFELFKPFVNESIGPALIGDIVQSPIGKMIDSWGKLGNRLLVGNFGMDGAYDECKSMEEAKYCHTTFTPIMIQGQPIPGSNYGTCVPKSCNNEDVYQMQKMLEKGSSSFISFEYPECEEEKKYGTGVVVTIIVLSVIILLNFLGTLTEVLQDAYTPSKEKLLMVDSGNESSEEKMAVSTSDTKALVGDSKTSKEKDNIVLRFLLSFSLLKNTRAILSTKQSPGAITSVNGIRTLSMTWVILGHTIIFSIMPPGLDNTLLLFDSFKSFTYLVIINAYVSVDSFFMLSGLLVAYLTLKSFDKRGIMSVKQYLLYVIHRYLRLTPCLIIMIIFFVNIYPLILAGPTDINLENNSGQGMVSRKPCIKYWWTNILYVNNFYPTATTDECANWTWYLANDTQFYIVSPLFLIIMYLLETRLSKFKNLCLFLFMAFLSSIFFVIVIVLIAVNNYPALVTSSFLPNNPRAKQSQDGMSILYFKPYSRIPSYLVGLFLGYILSRNFQFKSQHRRAANLIGWCMSIAVALAIIYGPWHVFRENDQYFMGNLENIIYGAFHRFAWALCVGWVVYTCHNKMGGLVNNILSWKAWLPLSRLTYCTYLLHPIVIYYYYQSHQNPNHYQTNLVPYHYVAFVVISYMLGFILSVFVEVPTRNVENLIFGR